MRWIFSFVSQLAAFRKKKAKKTKHVREKTEADILNEPSHTYNGDVAEVPVLSSPPLSNANQVSMDLSDVCI